jgi:hypothetical protein
MDHQEEDLSEEPLEVHQEESHQEEIHSLCLQIQQSPMHCTTTNSSVTHLSSSREKGCKLKNS